MSTSDIGFGVCSGAVIQGWPSLRNGAMALVLLTLCSLPALAHDELGTSVMGRVLDQTGLALAGVDVELVTSGAEFAAVSGLDGSYRFDRIPAGPAELTFRLIDFSVLR